MLRVQETEAYTRVISEGSTISIMDPWPISYYGTSSQVYVVGVYKASSELAETNAAVKIGIVGVNILFAVLWFTR